MLSRAQLLKPYPRFTTVSAYRDNDGRSQYDGVQLRLDRRFTNGAAFFVSYTRSRLLDDASSVFSATVVTGPEASFPVADSFNRALEWDLSNGDITNILNISGMWQVPYGAGHARRGRGWRALLNDWELSGVLTLQSGLPLPVIQAVNFNGFAGFGTQRPNLVGNPELPAASAARALVRHRRLRDRPAVHPGQQLAQPGARPGLPHPRPGARAASPARRDDARVAPRDVQRAQRHEPGAAQRGARHAGFRIDHVRARPAGRATRAQDPLLVDL